MNHQSDFYLLIHIYMDSDFLAHDGDKEW
jgi:hypothetical protein